MVEEVLEMVSEVLLAILSYVRTSKIYLMDVTRRNEVSGRRKRREGWRIFDICNTEDRPTNQPTNQL